MTVCGPRRPADGVARDASELLAGNVLEVVRLLVRGGRLAPDWSDDLLASCCVTRDGALLRPPGAPPGEPVAPARGGEGIRTTTAGQAAAMLAGAGRVVVVPGFGLAASRGHHALSVLLEVLRSRGAYVRVAVHPVAGRFPGHLNVLLDDAGVPPDLLLAPEAAATELERADVALVVGANDVVNPAAREDPASPLRGITVLDAAAAREVLVLARGGGPGFAGVGNALLRGPRTRLLPGDARTSLTALLGALPCLPVPPASPGLPRKVG